MFSNLWNSLYEGSSELIPAPFGSAAIDGFVRLPAYVIRTLRDGAALFGS